MTIDGWECQMCGDHGTGTPAESGHRCDLQTPLIYELFRPVQNPDYYTDQVDLLAAALGIDVESRTGPRHAAGPISPDKNHPVLKVDVVAPLDDEPVVVVIQVDQPGSLLALADLGAALRTLDQGTPAE